MQRGICMYFGELPIRGPFVTGSRDQHIHRLESLLKEIDLSPLRALRNFGKNILAARFGPRLPSQRICMYDPGLSLSSSVFFFFSICMYVCMHVCVCDRYCCLRLCYGRVVETSFVDLDLFA